MSIKHNRLSIVWKIIFATVITHLGNTTCTLNVLEHPTHLPTTGSGGEYMIYYFSGASGNNDPDHAEKNEAEMNALADVELTYIGNDSYLSDCGTSTGDDVDAWCDDTADFEGFAVSVSCNKVTINWGWYTQTDATWHIRACYFELRDEFGALKAFVHYHITSRYHPSYNTMAFVLLRRTN